MNKEYFLTGIFIGIISTLISILIAISGPTSSNSGSLKVLRNHGNITMEQDHIFYESNEQSMTELELDALAQLADVYVIVVH